MGWVRVDDKLAGDPAAAAAAAVAALAELRDTPKTYPQRQPPLERCSSCSGVINQQTGECRCSD